MCGISGFCTDEKVAVETVEEFLRVSWDSMSHRGRDAAGWMATNEDGSGVDKDKHGGNPLTLMEEGILFYPAATNSLAAHNRAGTKGSASNNQNNHPVVFGDVQICHNGSINNHNQVMNKILSMKRYKNVDKKKLPEVDSLAIAAVVDAYLPNPEALVDNYDAIVPFIEASDALNGGWAFMATWNKYPGYQLVARMNQSPVCMAFDDELKKFVYASESGPASELAELVGVQQDNLRILDNESILLFKDGKLVQIWKFRYNRQNRYNNSKITMVRNRNGKPFGEYKLTSDIVQKKELPKRAAEWNDKEFPGEFSEIDLDQLQDINNYRPYADADYLFRYKYKNDTVLYAYYGDVEVVSECGRVIDVYVGHNPSSDSWTIIDHEKENKQSLVQFKQFADGMSLKDMLVDISVEVTNISVANEQRDAARRRRDYELPLLKEGRKLLARGVTEDEYEVWSFFPDAVWEDEEDDAVKVKNGKPPLSPGTKKLFPSKFIQHVAYAEDTFCSDHKCTFSSHSKPEFLACQEAIDQYLLALLNIQDVFDVVCYFGYEYSYRAGVNHNHDLKVAAWVEFEGNSITLREECGYSSCRYEFRVQGNPIDTFNELFEEIEQTVEVE